MIENLKPTRIELVFLIFYLLALITAECFLIFYNLQLGLILEAVIIFALLIHLSVTRSPSLRLLLCSMTAFPIVLIIGLSLPMIPIPQVYWFILSGIILFAISYTLMKAQSLTRQNVGLTWSALPLQLLIACTGIIFGVLEYSILHPLPLNSTINLESLVIGSIIIIISTGFAEELLFRGIIQRNAQNALGAGLGILYSTLLFTALNISHSLPDVIFIFLVGLFYGYIFYKTRSIIGISLAHGISNTMLLLIIPYYLAML
jgi:membrane protease YdiL (CAAX protease family)